MVGGDNLQEGRHALARKICHGKKGELFHFCERGLENQLGVLGMVLHCVVLWNTTYLNAAVEQVENQGCAVREEDIARLSPFVSKHLGVHGTYSFLLPDLAPGAIREIRDPDAPDDAEEDDWSPKFAASLNTKHLRSGHRPGPDPDFKVFSGFGGAGPRVR